MANRGRRIAESARLKVALVVAAMISSSSSKRRINLNVRISVATARKVLDNPSKTGVVSSTAFRRIVLSDVFETNS